MMNHVYKERFPKVMAMGGMAASVPSQHPGSFCRKITYLCWNIGCMNRYGVLGSLETWEQTVWFRTITQPHVLRSPCWSMCRW